ncbi:MAG TPA: DUF4276 family protein [Thermoguttaceae bacterium]|nr:DUF4276 family protein [Thermoguttaceae bacterium]
MNELVFLLEEPSIIEVLRVLVPVLVPDHVICRFVPHEGKSDLEKSIPRKLRAWQTPGVRFVVVRDKDQGNCHTVKDKLLDLCRKGRRPDTLVRIVCHHLESWHLGDLAAVEKAFALNGIARRQNQRKFRDPDALPNAEQELRRLVPQYQKIAGSRKIAPHLDVDNNRSHSFGVFLSGVRGLFGEETKAS